MNKHTPGPLVRIVDSDGSVKQVIDRADAKYMRLIAAAPDMAEALRIVEDAMTPDDGNEDDIPERCRVALHTARAALAKAVL